MSSSQTYGIDLLDLDMIDRLFICATDEKTALHKDQDRALAGSQLWRAQHLPGQMTRTRQSPFSRQLQG
jgi:hypothetical protein